MKHCNDYLMETVLGRKTVQDFERERERARSPCCMGGCLLLYIVDALRVTHGLVTGQWRVFALVAKLDLAIDLSERVGAPLGSGLGSDEEPSASGIKQNLCYLKHCYS